LEYWEKCWDNWNTGISVGILEYWNNGKTKSIGVSWVEMTLPTVSPPTFSGGIRSALSEHFQVKVT
jgi:hypothetical protein